MRNLHHTLFIVILAILSNSCEKEIVPPKQQEKNQWVIHGMLQLNDTTITILIDKTTHTFHTQENLSHDPISQATVTLSTDGSPQIPLAYTPSGRFTTSHPSLVPVTEGKKYYLTVSGEYGTASAECTAITKNNTPIYHPQIVHTRSDGDNATQVFFEIKNTPHDRTFYTAYAELIATSGTTQGMLYQTTTQVHFKPFSNFSNPEEKLSVRSEKLWNYAPIDTPDSISVKLYQIDSHLYKYFNTIYSQSDSEDLEPFVEPIMIISNIHNGFGVFGTYSVIETKQEIQ